MSAIIASAVHRPIIRNIGTSPMAFIAPVGLLLLRAILVWCLILTLEFIHGVARTMWLIPLVGDLRSRQIGVVFGSLLIVLVAFLTVRWIGARSPRQLFVIGLAWLVLMLGAEILIGREVFGYPWSRIAEDFDPRQGGLLGVGMLVLAASPWLAHRLRSV